MKLNILLFWTTFFVLIESPITNKSDSGILNAFGSNLNTLKVDLSDLDSLRNPFVPQFPETKTPWPSKVPLAPVTAPLETSVSPVVEQPAAPVTLPNSFTPPEQKEILPPSMNIYGLIWNTNRPQAIVNNQIVQVGDKIENWTIDKIDQNGLEISGYGKTVFISSGFNEQNNWEKGK